MLDVAGLSHLTLHVTDLARAEGFYRDVLGLQPLGRDLVADDGPTSLFRTEAGHMLVLVEVASVEAIRGQNTAIHHAWYLTPEQYAGAVERMKAHGYDVKDNHEGRRAMGEKSIDIFDPDGHRFQLQAVGPEAREVLKANRGKMVCGHLDTFAEGSVTLFNDGKFYLVRNADGFMALSRWCTHMNGLVQWKPNHWFFHCPYHKAIYDRAGAPISPSPRFANLAPLRMHPVEIDAEGMVSVDTDVVLIRKGTAPEDATPAIAAAQTCAAHLERV